MLTEQHCLQSSKDFKTEVFKLSDYFQMTSQNIQAALENIEKDGFQAWEILKCLLEI